MQENKRGKKQKQGDGEKSVVAPGGSGSDAGQESDGTEGEEDGAPAVAQPDLD